MVCRFEGCENEHRARGLCSSHYTQWRRGRSLSSLTRQPRACAFEGCDRLPHGRQLCWAHLSQAKRGSDLRPIRKPGRARWVTPQGYVHQYLPGHPNARSTGVVGEHTVVMSEHLGRALVKGENVHHRNGVRDDNRVENLELWDTSQPPGQRAEEKLAYWLERWEGDAWADALVAAAHLRASLRRGA